MSGTGTKRGKARRVTSYDLANYLGVSQSVVSRCFRPGTKVSEEMRARVLKGAEELGYAPNAIARSLITRRSGILGLVVTEQTGLNVPRLLTGLARALAAHDRRLVLFVLDDESDRRELFRHVLSYQLEGLIAATTLAETEVAMLDKHEIPVVHYNRRAQGRLSTSVTCDQAGGMSRLVDRLLAKGYDSFAYFGGPGDSPVMRDRRAAVVERLKAAGKPLLAEYSGKFDVTAGGGHMQALMTSGHRPRAVICANDALAIGALDAARSEFGLSIPKDLAITGFDGLDAADWASYRLTTMEQPTTEMVARSVDEMIALLEDKGTARPPVTLDARFVEGATA